MKFASKVLLLAIAIVPLTAHAQIFNFQHIVVIFQENRTPDNLFQGLCTTPTLCSTTPTTSQYNIQISNWLDKNSGTGFTQPGPIPLANAYDLSHAHRAFTTQCDKDPVSG